MGRVKHHIYTTLQALLHTLCCKLHPAKNLYHLKRFRRDASKHPILIFYLKATSLVPDNCTLLTYVQIAHSRLLIC